MLGSTFQFQYPTRNLNSSPMCLTKSPLLRPRQAFHGLQWSRLLQIIAQHIFSDRRVLNILIESLVSFAWIMEVYFPRIMISLELGTVLNAFCWVNTKTFCNNSKRSEPSPFKNQTHCQSLVENSYI